MKSHRRVRLAGLSVAFATLATIAMAAEEGSNSLQGAWLAKGADCLAVYAISAQKASFRKPVDLFASAFIISGNRLTTPGASCRIKSLRATGGRQELTLDCVNAVAGHDVRALLARSPDGSLNRYLNAQDTSGSPYVNCVR